MISHFQNEKPSLIPVKMYMSHSCFLWGDKCGLAWVVPWALTTEVPTLQFVKSYHAKRVVSISLPRGYMLQTALATQDGNFCTKVQRVGKYKSINEPEP